MKELQIKYTLGELKQLVDESSYTVLGRSNACRSGDEQELLTGSMLLSRGTVSACTSVSVFTALTKDNYLVTTTILEDTYGNLVKHDWFGLGMSCHHKVETIFNTLPKTCQDELIATEWLAKNPTKLVAKLQAVLEAPVRIIEDQENTIARTEEMLVNAHHNMKKSPKEMFTKSWLKWGVMKKLPWLRSCLEKEGEK